MGSTWWLTRDERLSEKPKEVPNIKRAESKGFEPLEFGSNFHRSNTTPMQPDNLNVSSKRFEEKIKICSRC